jgi:NhaP-type Na+/H+ or K+/H+ antiporter
VATGFLGGRILHWGTRVGLVNHIFQQLASLALALVAFAGAEAVGGNGFIAAFAAGLTLGNTARGICTCLYEFAEAEGQLLALLAFLTFGAADVFPGAWNLGIPVVLYAVLSLTLVRMAPVSVSLVGSGLAPVSHGFLGWFGPRGLASILYVFLILEELQTPATDTIFQVVIVTVLLSVFAHGLSASPGAAAYAARINKAIPRKPSHVEAQPVGEHPLRINPRHR